MKEQKEKKSGFKWWIIAAIAGVLVAAAGVIFFVIGMNGREDTFQQSRLYWNVEGKNYRNGNNIRYEIGRASCRERV